MVCQASPNIPDLVTRLIEMTSPDAGAIMQMGESAVNRLDREVEVLWKNIICCVTRLSCPAQGIVQMTGMIPGFYPALDGGHQRACEELQVSMQSYFQSQMQAVMGQGVTVTSEENMKHTVIALKGVHDGAVALLRYLQRSQNR